MTGIPGPPTAFTIRIGIIPGSVCSDLAVKATASGLRRVGRERECNIGDSGSAIHGYIDGLNVGCAGIDQICIRENARKD